MQFGYHLTLDLYGCELNLLMDYNKIYSLLEELPLFLGMKSLIPPYLIKAKSNEITGGKDPGGITAFIVIAESHISIHTFAKRGFVSMDVYSCKIFDYDKCIEYLKNFFNPRETEIHKIDRGLKYPETNIY